MMFTAIMLASGVSLLRAADTPKIGSSAAYSSTQQELRFTENKGQWDPRAKFLAQSSAVDLWVTTTGIVYDWHEDKLDSSKKLGRTAKAVNVEFVGATGKGKAEGIRPLRGTDNFFLGKKVAARAHSFGAARINDLYPGIDLVTYFDEYEHRPRYDLVVHPGADPNQIRMRYNGADKLTVSPKGELNYRVAFGKQDVKVSEQRQMAYQEGDRGVPFRFMPKQVLEKDGTVGFNVDGYRKDRTLVIDPLVWATYVSGGLADYLGGTRVDSAGNVYASGLTVSPSFPVTTGVTQGSGQYAFLVKFDSSGNRVYSTVFGVANDNTEDSSLGFDGNGNAYLAGWTTSHSLPVTDGSTYPASNPLQTGFWAKFDGAGALVACDYVGGANPAESVTGTALYVATDGTSLVGVNESLVTISPSGVAATPVQGFTGAGQIVTIDKDGSGNVFVAGTTSDASLPGFSGYATTNPSFGLSPACEATFVSKLPPGATTPVQETLIPCIGNGIPGTLRIDPSGQPTVAGGYHYSKEKDSGGHTVAASFPTTPGAYSTTLGPTGAGFVCKLSNDLTTLNNSTLFGLTTSTGGVEINSMALDPTGAPVFCGDFFGGATVPLTWDYFSGGKKDSFIARLSPDLSTLLYSSYFPGSSLFPASLDLDSNGLIYLGGFTQNADLPTTSGAFQTTFSGVIAGYIAVLNPVVSPSLNSIHSDRGATPAIAGGVGKSTNIAVQFAEPIGTTITLSSDSPTLVQVNNANSASYTTVGAEHITNFTVSAIKDVAVDTPVVLTASDGTHALTLTLTIKPFLRLVVLQPTTVLGGGVLTGYVYPYEVPQTDQTATISANPSLAFSSFTLPIPGLSSGGTNGPRMFTVNTNTVATDTTVNVTAALVGGASDPSAAFTLVGVEIKSIVFSPSSVNAGQTSTATVTLKNPLPVDETLTLTSTNPIAPNFTVFIPAHTTTGTGSVTTLQQSDPAATLLVDFSDVAHAPSVVGVLKVTPVQVASLSLDRSSVAEGDTPNLTVKLNFTVLNSQAVSIFCSTPAYVGPVTATVAAGSNTVIVPLPTNNTGLTASRQVRINGQIGVGRVAATTLTILPEVTSVTLSPLTITGGNSSAGLVSFLETYTGVGSVTVTTSDSVAYIGAPGTQSVTLPANGLTSVPFSISTSTVTTTHHVVITVTPLNRAPVKFNLTVDP